LLYIYILIKTFILNGIFIFLFNKVIGVTKLKKKYKPYEAKRQLCNSYDIFLSDDRVIPILPKLIGKSFYEKKK